MTEKKITQKKLEAEFLNLQLENQELNKTVAAYQKELRRHELGDLYIVIEMSERDFVIGKKIVGTNDQFLFVARSKNRAQTKKMVSALNNAKREN